MDGAYRAIETLHNEVKDTGTVFGLMLREGFGAQLPRTDKGTPELQPAMTAILRQVMAVEDLSNMGAYNRGARDMLMLLLNEAKERGTVLEQELFISADAADGEKARRSLQRKYEAVMKLYDASEYQHHARSTAGPAVLTPTVPTPPVSAKKAPKRARKATVSTASTPSAKRQKKVKATTVQATPTLDTQASQLAPLPRGQIQQIQVGSQVQLAEQQPVDTQMTQTERFAHPMSPFFPPVHEQRVPGPARPLDAHDFPLTRKITERIPNIVAPPPTVHPSIEELEPKNSRKKAAAQKAIAKKANTKKGPAQMVPVKLFSFETNEYYMEVSDGKQRFPLNASADMNTKVTDFKDFAQATGLKIPTNFMMHVDWPLIKLLKSLKESAQGSNPSQESHFAQRQAVAPRQPMAQVQQMQAAPVGPVQPTPRAEPVNAVPGRMWPPATMPQVQPQQSTPQVGQSGPQSRLPRQAHVPQSQQVMPQAVTSQQNFIPAHNGNDYGQNPATHQQHAYTQGQQGVMPYRGPMMHPQMANPMMYQQLGGQHNGQGATGMGSHSQYDAAGVNPYDLAMGYNSISDHHMPPNHPEWFFNDNNQVAQDMGFYSQHQQRSQNQQWTQHQLQQQGPLPGHGNPSSMGMPNSYHQNMQQGGMGLQGPQLPVQRQQGMPNPYHQNMQQQGGMGLASPHHQIAQQGSMGTQAGQRPIQHHQQRSNVGQVPSTIMDLPSQPSNQVNQLPEGSNTDQAAQQNSGPQFPSFTDQLNAVGGDDNSWMNFLDFGVEGNGNVMDPGPSL
ncbi:hypothetical protein OQA88_11325 [Cercophora sp. LCS_1]